MSHNPPSEFDIPLSEKVKMLPGFFGLALEEQVPYEVLKNDNTIEIRSYGPQLRASMICKGDFREASKEALDCLAGYIFGQNLTNEKITMTTPVLMREKSEDKEWLTSFILPPSFILKTAPRPEDKRITLSEHPAHLVASISYAGINNTEKIKEHSAILKKWLKRRPWYVPLGEFQTAQYDGPLTIPFFRKNEIHIDIKHIH